MVECYYTIWFKKLVLFFANKLGLMACAPHRDHRYTQVRWGMDCPMATRFVGEVLFGNFSRTKDMMSIEDGWKKDRIFQVFNKTMDIYLSLFSSIISWSSWSLNYNEKPKDTTTDSLLPPGSWLCSSMASRGQSWTDANCRIWRQAAGAFCARGVGWEWGGSGTHVPPRNFRGEKCPCLDVPGS